MSDNVSPLKTSMTWGLVLGVIVILFNLIPYLFGVYEAPTWVGLISFAFIVAIIVIGQKKHRDDDLGGYITYGRAFLTGLLIMVFGYIIYSFYFILLVKVVDPSYMDKMLDIAAAKYYEMGYDDDMVEALMQTSASMTSPVFMLLSSIFGGALLGTIISLISSAFIKREQPVFPTQE